MAVDKLVDSTQLDSDLTSVANAIRTKGGTSGQLAFPNEFVSAIENIPTGGGDWVRPSNWPDYSKMNLTNFSGTYFTYDLSATDDPYCLFVSIYAQSASNKQSKVERGHFDASGNFVADESYETTSYMYKAPLDPENGIIQIWRTYGHITDLDKVRFAEYNGTYSGRMQPCVEIYVKSMKPVGFEDIPAYTVKSITEDGLTANSGIYRAFQNFSGVEQIIFKNSNITITDSRACFNNCRSLKKIEFGGISYSGSGLSFFSQTLALKKLAVPNWTVSSGQMAVMTTISNVEELDLTKMDVSAVTTWGANIIQSVHFLKTLKMTGMDFSGLTSNPSFDFPVLTDLYPPAIGRSQTWTCPALTHESLLRLLNVLPTVQSAQTLTIGSVSTAKLTSQEIEIATAKGWTVA